MSEGRKTDWKGGLEYQSSPFSSRFSSLHWGYFWSFYVTGQVNLQENGYIKYTLLHAENSCKMQRPIWDIVFIPSACCAAQLGHSKKTNERPVLAVCPQKFSPKILFDVPQKSKTFCWPDVGSRNLRMLNTSFLYLLYTYPQPTETCLPSQENRNWVFCYWKQFIPVISFDKLQLLFLFSRRSVLCCVTWNVRSRKVKRTETWQPLPTTMDSRLDTRSPRYQGVNSPLQSTTR